MFDLTLIERYVIDTVSKKQRSLESLKKVLCIKDSIASNIIKSLVEKNIIAIKDNKYYINNNLSKEQINLINDEDNLKVEYSHIIKSSIYNKKNFNLIKFQLEEKDKEIFQAMLKNIEMFIQNNKALSHDVKDDEIFYWGSINYKEAIDYYLT
ncbi:MAG: hypothetical protein N4A33_13100 [Bacteriovoracaceae bacterium]|jgi:hypothetical protein|nr:hypothetical protein [Bacteriovoracaceae bacterium]